MLPVLLALQGLVLALHWLVKGVFRRCPTVDPSGHARVCLDTIVYAAWLSGAAPVLKPSAANVAVAALWVALQIGTVFVSRLTHHTLLDLLLGFACAAPSSRCTVCSDLRVEGSSGIERSRGRSAGTLTRAHASLACASRSAARVDIEA